MMAILITAEVANQTQQGYDGILAMAEPLIKQAPGFIMHAAYPVERGLARDRGVGSNAAAAEFFATYIAPNLPPGIKPKHAVQELYSLVNGA